MIVKLGKSVFKHGGDLDVPVSAVSSLSCYGFGWDDWKPKIGLLFKWQV